MLSMVCYNCFAFVVEYAVLSFIALKYSTSVRNRRQIASSTLVATMARFVRDVSDNGVKNIPEDIIQSELRSSFLVS